MSLLACYWLLVIDLYLESEILDHPPDFWGRLAWCGEVTVHEDGVGWIEGQCLETAKIVFAATGHTEFGAWVQKPEEAEYFQASLRSQVVTVF